MSAFVVSLMFTAGATTWIYAKFMRSTGNNTKTAVIACSVAALFIFFVFFSIFRMIVK